MIQLSSHEHSALKHNSIHVTNINSTLPKCIQYDTITSIGSKLNTRIQILKLGDEDCAVQVIDVTKTKKRVFCITTTVKDILSVSHDTIVIPSTSRFKHQRHELTSVDPEGIVLLYFANMTKPLTSHTLLLDEEFAKKVNQVKIQQLKRMQIIMAVQFFIIVLATKVHTKE